MTTKSTEETVRIDIGQNTQKGEPEILEEFLDKGWRVVGRLVFIPPHRGEEESTIFCTLQKPIVKSA